MITLYFYPSPNGLKATIMLEECGLEYRIAYVDITRGAQFEPDRVPYGIKPYTDEVNRFYGALERALAEGEWIAGGYSIADMTAYPWLMHHDKQGQPLENFPNLHRWYQAMGARPTDPRDCRRIPLH